MKELKTQEQIIEEEVNKVKEILDKNQDNQFQLGIIQGLRRAKDKNKAEAIKWVKKFDSYEGDLNEKYFDTPNWIELFFNLNNEEELRK